MSKRSIPLQKPRATRKTAQQSNLSAARPTTTRIGALVAEILQCWDLIPRLEKAQRNLAKGTTLGGIDRGVFLGAVETTAQDRSSALEQMLSWEEPETPADALAIVALLNLEFRRYSDEAYEREDISKEVLEGTKARSHRAVEERHHREMIERMIVAVARWLYRHAGSPQCSALGDHYFNAGAWRLAWPETVAHADAEMRTTKASKAEAAHV